MTIFEKCWKTRPTSSLAQTRLMLDWETQQNHGYYLTNFCYRRLVQECFSSLINYKTHKNSKAFIISVRVLTARTVLVKYLS